MNHKLAILCLMSVLLCSCNHSAINKENEGSYSEIELIEETDLKAVDKTDFQSFLSLFKKVDLPYELKYGNFYSESPGIDTLAFKKSEDNGLPFEKLDKEYIELWVFGNGNVDSELDEWLGKYLTREEDEWFSVTSGIMYENISRDKFYVLLNTFEKTSEVNGGYYTEWLLEYDGDGLMKSCYKLGREGFYTSAHVDFESGDYKRFSSFNSIQIKVINRYYVTVSNLEWHEMEGYLESEDYDGIGDYFEVDGRVVYDVEVKSYGIKF